MANRIFLVLAQSADPNADYSEDDVVVAASWMFPVLWASVFSARDRYMRHIEWTEQYVDGTSESYESTYPIVLAARDTVRQRARERRGRFLEFFSAQLERYYQEWFDLIDGMDAPYVFVDTQELSVCYDSPAQFEERLIAYLAAFEGNSRDDWLALIGQAESMQYDPATGQVTMVEGQDKIVPFELHGYEWMRDVPWEE